MQGVSGTVFQKLGSFFSMARQPRAVQGFTISFRHTTLDRTPLDERSARHTHTHTQHPKETGSHALGRSNSQFAIRADAYDRAATGIGDLGGFIAYRASIRRYIQ